MEEKSTFKNWKELGEAEKVKQRYKINRDVWNRTKEKKCFS
jgi:hypothetical protein